MSSSEDTGWGRAGVAEPRHEGLGTGEAAGIRMSVITNTEDEPEVRAWTKRKSAIHLMTEAEDLLRAWQLESGITASGSDTGHRDGTLSTTATTEGRLDGRNSMSTGETVT